MSYLPTNSTNTILLANQEFVGEGIIIDTEFISITCSFNSNVGGILEFFHSIDGFNYSNYNDIFDFTDKPGSHSIEVSVKGKYFKIRYLNGSQNQSVFNLFCKINKQVAEAILNATYDSITVYAGGQDGLNIRHLNNTTDSVAIPQLNPVIINDGGITCVNVRVNSMPPIVIPPISIGDVNIKDSNGNDILSNEIGYLQTQIMNTSLTVNTISGYATSANQATAQSSLNSLVSGVRIQASNGNNITVDGSNNLNVKEINSSDIKTGINNLNNKYLSSNTDSVSVYAGGENGLNIRSLTSTVDSVDVGLATYAYSNRDPPFPATRDVLSVQLCGVDDLEGSSLINLVSDTNGALLVNVNNTSLAVTGDFYPATQPISGSVSVSNLPATQPISGSVSVSNFPATQPISGSVSVSNTSLAVTGDFYPATQPISGSVSVSNFPATQPISGSVNVSNTSLAVTGDFYPATQPISGSVSVSNFPATQPISGSVSVSNITNTTIAGEVGTNVFINNTMANAGNVAIHATKGGTVKDLNGSSHGALYTEVYDSNKKMKIDNNGSNFSVITDSSGNNINSTNTGSVYSLNTHDYHISQAYNPTNTSINTTFTNTSISSKLQDGSANNITSTTNSTKRGIDCNIINSGSIATTDTNLTFDASNNLNVNIASGSISVSSVNIKDSSGNNLGAVSASVPQLKTTLYDTSARAIGSTTNNSGASYSLDTHITNTSSNKIPVDIGNSIALSVNVSDFAGNSVTSDSFSFNGATKNGLDVAIINNSANAVPVSTTLSGATSSIKLGDGSSSASFIAPNGSMNTGSRSLQTCASMYALSATAGTMTNCNTVSNTVSGLTTTDLTTFDGQVNNKLTTTNSTLGTMNTTLGTINSTLSDINSSTTSIATTNSSMDTKTVQQYNTTNFGGITGLNIYQIRPKVRFYTLRGRNIVADRDMIMGSVGNTRYFTSDAFGIANVKPWWCYSETVARTITYEYVDSLGNEGTRSQLCPANVFTALPLANGSAGNFLINNWTQSINTSSATGTVYICHTTQSGSYASAGGGYTDKFNSLFTCPKNYVFTIQNIVFYSNAPDDYLLMIRWNAQGIREVVFYWTYSKLINQNYASQFGGVGPIFTEGDTVAFTTLNPSSSYKDISATIMLMPV